MKTPKLPVEWRTFRKKIKDLEKNNSHFRRMYSEYENTNNAIWEMETQENKYITDELILSLRLQAESLGTEIEVMLKDELHC